MRDEEVVRVTLDAALTGHRVITTYHAGDIPSVYARMLHQGFEPFLVSSSVMAVFAQRLVRSICPECKTSYVPDDRALENIGIDREALQENVLWGGSGSS